MNVHTNFHGMNTVVVNKAQKFNIITLITALPLYFYFLVDNIHRFPQLFIVVYGGVKFCSIVLNRVQEILNTHVS